MALKIENNIVNKKSELPKAPVQQEKAESVILIGQSKDNKTAAENPVEGYYIEKTAQIPDNDDDDKLDTSVNPDARITLKNPSIAIYKGTSEITDAMEQTVDRAVATAFQLSGEDAFYKAADLIKNKQAYNCFEGINYTNRFNVYGKAVYENLTDKLKTESKNEGEDITSVSMLSRNSVKADLGINYKSKSENTKAMLFSSFTKTNVHATVKMEDVYVEGTDKYNSYSVYGAAQHKLKNKDFGTVSAFHINDAVQYIKTTNVNANYFFNKYMALIHGNADIYEVLEQKSVTKVNFNISLNPELASSEQKTIDTQKQEADTKTETKITPKTTGKKWSKNFSPFFDTQSINGSTEEGLGGQMRFKRAGNNSTFRVETFGKASTTQLEENNQYHVTFGSGVKCTKKFNSQSLLNAGINLKDRITFGQGNIATADAALSYTSPNLTAEIEGKYINITHPNSPIYAGVVGRIFYTPNKNINLFGEASYADMKYPVMEISSSNIQAGVMFNF